MSHRGTQTRRLLLVGFGGILLLLAITGLNAVSVLKAIQSRNEQIRQDYVNRERILEQLRSDVYLSGTYVRDLLLEPDPARADTHRNELEETRSRIKAMIAEYAGILRGEERAPFQQFEREVSAYFDSLRPALQWNADQRRELGYAFMQNSLLPRRMVIVHLADQISRINQKQLESGNRQVAALFASFRRSLLVLFLVTLACGLVLAAGSMYRILRLERLSAERFEEMVRTRAALRDLSARLVEVQETERRALSRELHDEVGQSLSALLLAIDNVSATLPSSGNPESRVQLHEIRRLAERTVTVVRDMSLLLRPSMLDDLGLVPALQWQAREISRNNNVRIDVQADLSSEHLPDEHKTCIYRVVQEALRNVTRHARAKSVQIRLTRPDGTLHLTIQDDGQGFIPERDKGMGLLGMQERVSHLRGAFELVSRPGKGTVINVELPLADGQG
ncbi:MAG TPA: MCP four helix bundle domain-containing protein [Bryobacteraceae bacterium]|nr:MCP four helix bundle domain-containing protein [Bryobacteraceae bacterium]